MGIVALDDGHVDVERRVVVRGGEELRLSTTEARLLAHLVHHSGRAWSREELQVQVWGYRPGIPSRTVFTTVGRLRVKIEADPRAPRHLVTESGEGYRFVPAASSGSAASPGSTASPGAALGARRGMSALPAAATPFVGRVDELARCRALLEQGVRVLTLLGPGGVGKTRLALALAADPPARFPDGAVFVPLDTVSAAAGIPSAIAAACGRTLPVSERDGLSSVIDTLLPRAVLLVLDNLEHLLDGGPALIDELSAACPRATLLVTSRVRLSLRRETAFVVHAMGLPATSDELERSDAGRLLLGSARRARPGWEPSPPERETLARICQLVGGSPLALELAGAWLRLLEPEEIAAELGSSIDILRSSMRDVPERHRSVRGALEASWRLLAPEAAQALSALSVFRGPFDRKAAQHVASTNLMVLGQLVDSSMVRRQGGRFELHPLVRQLAAEKLTSEAGSAVGRRHGELFLGRLEQAWQRSDRGETTTPEFREELLPDLDELIAAFRWALAVVDVAWLARTIEPMRRALDATNRFGELVDLFRLVAETLAGEEPSRDRDRALGLTLAFLPGLGAGGIDNPERVLSLLQPVGGDALALGLVHVAISGLMGGGGPEAEEFAARAVAQSRESGRVWPLAFSLSISGVLQGMAGRFDEAEAELEEARQCALSTGNRHLAARPLVHLGEMALLRGELALAEERLRAAVDACRDTQDQSFASLALSRLGEVWEAQGRDPTGPWVEAIEEVLVNRLPLHWWSYAVCGFGRLLCGRGGEDAALGVALLIRGGQDSPTLETRRRAQQDLAAARETLPPDALARGEEEARCRTTEELVVQLLAM